MKESINIVFTGDISLNDGYTELAREGIDPFGGIASIIKESDLVVGNLEAVCADVDGKHHPKRTRLSIDPLVLPLLIKINLGLATLANNHVFDNLDSGLATTLEFFNKNNISYIGAGLEKNDLEPYIFEKNGIKITFLNYVHHNTHTGVKETDSIKLNLYDKDKISREIKNCKIYCNYVILILHWGQDNSHYPAPWQRRDARRFVDAGCDILIGHHSHVLQGMEKIGKSLVFYGLGNLAFAPITDQSEIDQSRQIESILVNIQLDQNEIMHDIFPIQLSGLIPEMIDKSIFDKLSRQIPFISNRLIWPVYLIYLNLLYKIAFYFYGNRRRPIAQLKKINWTKIKRFLTILTKFHN